MPLLKALFCQTLACVSAILIGVLLIKIPMNILSFVILQAILATSLSRLIQQPVWWRLIHLFFMPAIFFMQYVQLPSVVYLLAFILSVLIFWGTVKGDVPLFLSSADVVDHVLSIVASEQAYSFVDIGAGLGSMVVPLAKRNPKLQVFAVERAPLPWLLLLCRCRLLNNVSVAYSDFWRIDLKYYSVVYAFLSPLVMEKVGKKVQMGMCHGSLFISCCFPVPDWQPETTIIINDKRQTQLFCYRINHH